MLPVSDPFHLRTIAVLMLSLTPFVLVLVQQRSVRRQQDVLLTLPEQLRHTELWKQARSVLDRRYFLKRRSKGTEPGRRAGSPGRFVYIASLCLVSIIMLASWAFILEEPFGNAWYVNDPNLLLAGPAPDVRAGTLDAFQTQTLAVSGIAFAVAYVVVLTRMLTRLNINDYSALENMFDAVHLVGAIVVSTVGRLLVAKTTELALPAMLLAVGVGLRPDFYLAAIGEGVWSVLSRDGGFLSGARDPARNRLSPGDMPPDLQLEAVDGCVDDVAARLRRIDVQTCHRLALCNPFVIWTRTNTTLQEVVDWVGQALLTIHFPDKWKALRSLGIRTITDLLVRCDDKCVADVLGPGCDPAKVASQLSVVPQIAHLRALSEALIQALASDPAARGTAVPKPSVADPPSMAVRDVIPERPLVSPDGPAGESEPGARGTAAQDATVAASPLVAVRDVIPERPSVSHDVQAGETASTQPASSDNSRTGP